MKVDCLQENLNAALADVGRAVASRTPLPITSNVLISTDGGRLKLSATNLELTITTWIGAKVEEEGVVTVPARLLGEFVGSLPSEEVHLIGAPGGKSLNVTCARFQANIAGTDPEEFPPTPTVDDGFEVNIGTELLKQAIDGVAFAAATEDSRPVLTGVQIEIKDGGLVLAAADGFRLAVHETKLADEVPESSAIIVPAKSLQEVSRLASGKDYPVKIKVNEGKTQVLFQFETAAVVSQLIQGTFPNYSQLVPKEHVSKTTVDVGEFARATRAASIFARDGSGIVRLQTSEGEEDGIGGLSVSARSEEVGDNKGKITATIEGDPAKIAFNAKYLTEVLGVLGHGMVALETSSPSSPGVLRPISSSEDVTYVHVVMPMFVQW
jgi:DNA polymerase-3 subunit beta